MKQISSHVHQTISNYQLTSKSKRFRRLTPKHEQKIVDAIVETHRSKQLVELISKRDHYAKKIYEMLNSAGAEADPLRIDDLTDAQDYLERRFIKLTEQMDQARSLIEKHKRFYQDMALRKKAIEDKYAGGRSYHGLSKLKTLNSHAEKDREHAKDSELAELYLHMMDTQKKYAGESAAMLNQLRVPFFASLQHGEHTREKEQILQLLYKLAEPSTNTI